MSEQTLHLGPRPAAATEGGNGRSGIADDSLLADLKIAAQEQQEETVHDFVVGGKFGKQLWLRHKPLDEGPMNRFITQRAASRENPKLDIPITELNMDLMAQSCVAVLGADKEGTKESKFELKDEQGVIRLEHRLMQFLDLPVPPPEQGLMTSREVVSIIFGRNAMAIVNYGDELVAWMQDPANYKSPGER
jgi:hypothetical protein